MTYTSSSESWDAGAVEPRPEDQAPAQAPTPPQPEAPAPDVPSPIPREGPVADVAAQTVAAPRRVIAVANQKGGVGKTTTVINLAACLAEKRKRILVVDLDPQCNATSGLGLEAKKGRSLYRPLLGEGSVSDLILSTPVKGVDMVPSELDLAGAEIDIARVDGYLHCFSNAMNTIEADRYDYVLVDCPPSLGILTMNALTAARSLIVPLQCEYYALEGLSVIVRLVQQLRESGANPRLEIEGILMTMYDGRTNLATQVVSEVEQHFGDRLYKTVIPRNVRLSEAPSFGQAVIHYDAHCVGADAYRRFAKEFLARDEARIRIQQPSPSTPS